MIRRSILCSVTLLLLLTATAAAADSASEQPWLLVFYEEGCPNCLEMEALLEPLTYDLPESAVARYEITAPDNLDLLVALGEEYGVDVSTVPVIFVGDVAIVGVGRTQEFELRNAVGDCIVEGCPSPFERIVTASSFRADLGRALWIALLFAVLWFWQTT